MSHDPAALDYDAIQQAGRMLFSIDGMWCASCAAALERIIVRTPGVVSAKVNFATASALVQWHPDQGDIAIVADRVRRLGYALRPPFAADEAERKLADEARSVGIRLVAAIFFGMWSMAASVPLYFDRGLATSNAGWWMAAAAGLLSLPVVLYAGLPFYRAGWRTTIVGAPGMDALISVGVLASLGLSAWRLASGSADVYFDTATMLISLLLVGRLIELNARKRAVSAMTALRAVMPDRAHRLGRDGQEAEVDASVLVPGDQIRVMAGGRIPVDGMVVSGSSAVDRSVLTGEASPAAVGVGSVVEAGSINMLRQIIILVERPVGQRTLDLMGGRIAEVLGGKGEIQRLADRVARLLVPAVLAVSAVTLFAGSLAGLPVEEALLRAVSALVVACPCAIGLAVPMAYVAATGAAAKRGILVRDAAAWEALAGAKTMLFDKTGTLTQGQPQVIEVRPAVGHSREEVLRLAAMAERGIDHPLAHAIVAAAPQGMGTGISPADGGTRLARGAEIRDEKGQVAIFVGSIPGFETPCAAAAASGMTRVEVLFRGLWIGAILMADEARPDAREAIHNLRSAGICLGLATGDAAGSAHAVAADLGLPQSAVHAACTPEDKAELVAAAEGPVVFIGDGINDAMALCRADVGIAMTGATATATAAAGIAIVGGGVSTIVEARELACRSMKVMRQNLALSAAYNALGLGFAVTGAIPPAVAAAAMLASSLSVLLNSARLARGSAPMTVPGCRREERHRSQL